MEQGSRRIRRAGCWVLSMAAMLGASQAWAAGNLAIIVNKTAAVIGLSKSDLRTIYLGDKDKWPSGQKVLPIALSSPEELKSFLKEVCGMSEGDYKKYFIQANFTGKTLTLPRLTPSAAVVKQIVSSTPGAIGFIPASNVDATVGVVRYNGALPTDANYQLKDSQ